MEMAYRDRWRHEVSALRAILGEVSLVEETKWGKPCYTLDGTNVVIIQPFKESIALGFFQGALMKDPKKLLVQLGETQAARMMRFTSAAEIDKKRAAIKSYLRDAMTIAKAGLKVESKPKDFPVPDELKAKFRADPALKKAFDALTPGRQRSHLFHFGEAKQSATRTARIEKAMPTILAGRGHLERP